MAWSEAEVDLERGIVRVKRIYEYSIWFDFGGVKRFFVYIEPGYAKYIERRPDGSLHFVYHEKGEEPEDRPITEEEAKEIIAETAKAWVSDY